MNQVGRPSLGLAGDDERARIVLRTAVQRQRGGRTADKVHFVRQPVQRLAQV